MKPKVLTLLNFETLGTAEQYGERLPSLLQLCTDVACAFSCSSVCFVALSCSISIMSDPAVLSVSNVLMPDGAVQTTSQLTFSNVADIANGQTLQNFMRGHLALHMESAQQQGALPRPSLHADRYSRPIDNSSAVPGPSRHRPRRRSRTPPAPRFRLHSAAPQRRSDEDDDETWGSWTIQPDR